MTTRIQARALRAAMVALLLVGCSGLKDRNDRAREDASTPDGGVDPNAGTGGKGQPEDAGMSGHAGTGGSNSTSDAGGTDGGPKPVAKVPATSHAFSTLGDARGGEGIRLMDDGFESGARRCTDNGSVCFTGGFEP